MEFSSSKSPAKMLSNLQPLLDNVEIQKFLTETLSDCPACVLLGFQSIPGCFPTDTINFFSLQPNFVPSLVLSVYFLQFMSTAGD